MDDNPEFQWPSTDERVELPSMGDVLRKIANDPTRTTIDWRSHFRQLADGWDASDHLHRLQDARATSLLKVLIAVGLAVVLMVGANLYLYWQLSECVARLT